MSVISTIYYRLVNQKPVDISLEADPGCYQVDILSHCLTLEQLSGMTFYFWQGRFFFNRHDLTSAKVEFVKQNPTSAIRDVTKIKPGMVCIPDRVPFLRELFSQNISRALKKEEPLGHVMDVIITRFMKDYDTLAIKMLAQETLWYQILICFRGGKVTEVGFTTLMVNIMQTYDKLINIKQILTN